MKSRGRWASECWPALIEVPDPDRALEIASLLLKTFPEPERVSQVHQAVAEAAGSFTFGTQAKDRYLKPLRVMMEGYPSSTAWLDGMVRACDEVLSPAERYALIMEYQQRFKKPLGGECVRRMEGLREIPDEAQRIAAAKQYLALEPIYADVKVPADYWQFVWVIFSNGGVFLAPDKPLVSTQMATSYFETVKRRYENDKTLWSQAISFVQATLAGKPEQSVAFYQQNLPYLDAGQVGALLAGTKYANHEAVLQANAAGKGFAYNVTLRWNLMGIFSEVKDKNGLTSAARNGLMLLPAAFNKDQFRGYFINSPIVTPEEKMALVSEIITKGGMTPPMKAMLDEMAKEKEKPESWANLKAFQDVQALAARKAPGNDPATVALVALQTIPGNANRPDGRILETAKTFLQNYKGRFPGGEDQIQTLEDQQVRDIFVGHQSHTDNNREGLSAWAKMWSERLPQGDLWLRMTERIAQHDLRGTLLEIAPTYIERTKGGKGDPKVWAFLARGNMTDAKQLTAFAPAYAQMGSDQSLAYLINNNARFVGKDRQSLVDEMAKAVAAGGAMKDPGVAQWAIQNVFNWGDPQNGCKPSVALIKFLEESYRTLSADKAAPEVLAMAGAMYYRCGYEAEGKAYTQRYIDEAKRKPIAAQVNALAALLRNGMLPQEAKELEPGKRIHTAVKVFWPALQQLPADQWPTMSIHWEVPTAFHGILGTKDDPSRPEALAASLRMVDMVSAGAKFEGPMGMLSPCLLVVAQQQIEAGNWTEFNRRAATLAEIVASDGNPEGQYAGYIQPLIPQLDERKAAEPLYVMLRRVEQRTRGQEAFVKRVQIAKARASAGIAGLIPVPQGDPMYDLYAAANELSVGQEAHAWELINSPAKLKLLMANWVSFDEQFVVWTADQLRKQKGKSLPVAMEFCFNILLEEPKLTPEVAGQVLLTKGDTYRDMENYQAARIEYEGLRNNDRYRQTAAGIKATYRLVELHVLTKNYAAAEAMLQRMEDADDIRTQAEAYYLYARIEYQQQNYVPAMEFVRKVKERVPSHIEAALLEGELKPYVRGGMENPIVEIGMEKLQTILVPGRPVMLKLHDRNLSIARAGAAIPVIVTTSVGGDEERINLLPTSSNRNLFQATVPTSLGKAQKGNMTLEVGGNDTVSYSIDEQFQKANDLHYPAKVLEVRSDARLAASSEEILSPEEQEKRELELKLIQQRELTSRQMDVSRDGRTIRPGSPIYVQVGDPDRDTTDAPDKVLVNLRTTSGDVLENFEVTETAEHSGIFQAAVPTTIPLPKADASDSEEGSSPAAMIRAGSQEVWTSRTDAVKPKWIEVDTMTSSEVASASVQVPRLEQVRSVTVLGMLADQYEEIASYPVRTDAAKGGVMVDAASEGQGSEIQQLRRHLLLAPTTPYWQASPVFERTEIRKDQGWITCRLRGMFYLPDSQVLEIKLLNQPVNNLTAYVSIDGQRLLGGQLNDKRALNATGKIDLGKGAHTLEILTTNFEQKSRVEVGYRKDDGEYAPLPAEWFSVEAHPELAEILKPRGTISLENGAISLAMNQPLRLRKLRVMFNDFNALSVSAGRFTITDSSGKVIVPGKEEFTQGRTNRTLEIAPGDEIVLTYTDSKRLWDGEQVLQAKLNSSYYNGNVALADEVITQDRENRITKYLPARRVRAGDQLAVLVTDYDLDTTAERDTVDVHVQTSSGQKLTLKALETSTNSANEAFHRHAGVFLAILKFAEQPGKDTIQIVSGDRITVSYLDSENTKPGVPVERTFAISESGRGSPRIMAYQSSIKMVEDTSLEAQMRLGRLTSTGKAKPVLYRPQPVVRHPEYIPEGSTPSTQPAETISSVAAPLLFEVTYPKLALNLGSVLKATLVSQSELDAAKSEGREPRTLTVPMYPDSIEALASAKGYKVQLQSRVRRDAEEMLRDGVFAGVVRLQVGGAKDPIDDLIVGVDREMIEQEQRRTGQEDDSAYRVPTLLVRGSDLVHVRVEDLDSKTIVEKSVRLRSEARLELVDSSYSVPSDAVHLGEKFFLRVTDPDHDVSDERDEVPVRVLSSSGDHLVMKLSETLPHSGIFTGAIEPQFIGEKVEGKVPAAKTDDDVLGVYFGDEVSFAYVDDLPLESAAPQTLEVKGRIHLGSDGQLAAFTKRFKDREIAVKTRFLMSEALFEMAKDHRKIGQTEQAKEEISRGKAILEEALRDYPGTTLAAQGDYLLANLAQELSNYGEAIGRYSMVVSGYPDSEYAPQSQFKKALCYELQENYDQACEEYVKLTYVYPDHALVADATIRLGNYYYKKQSYKVSSRIFYHFSQRNPTHRLAPQALFLAAQCEYKLKEYKEAIDLFSRTIEQYPDEKDIRSEAMYWLADSQSESGNNTAAYRTFKKLTWDYPDSKWAKVARGRLTEEVFMQAAEQQ